MEDPIVQGVALVLMVAMLLLFIRGLHRGLQEAEQDPRIILRRCRVGLYQIQADLRRLEASREVHDLYAASERAQRDCDRLESEIG